MNKNLTVQKNSDHNFTPEQVQILKDFICKGISDDELKVFLMACAKTNLDPFMKQIYAVKRWDSRLRRETVTIQTGIDGYRLIAERTGRYAPGRKPTFECDTNGNLVSATAYVKKMTADGTWHEVEAEAFLDEYCQTSLDKETGKKKATGMWVSMQRNQLAKCAESLCLRKAFPAEMSGVYTKEEMQQSELAEPKQEAEVVAQEVISYITDKQLARVKDLCKDLPRFESRIKEYFKIDDLSKILSKDIDMIIQNGETELSRKLKALEKELNHVAV